LSSIPDGEVTVVNLEHARLVGAPARHLAARPAQSLEDVLDEADVVPVASPLASHAELALTALDVGKHTLVEQPLTASITHGELLFHMAAGTGVPLMVGHTFEYNQAVGKLKEIVRLGMIGPILHIRASRLSLGRSQRDVNVVILSMPMFPRIAKPEVQRVCELPEDVTAS